MSEPWEWPPEQLRAEIKASGLLGRGGAGFPVWRKWESMPARRLVGTSRRRVVIGNGAEGEPLSCKDAVLLQRDPHQVIDGLLVAAAAVHADELHLHLDEAAESILSRALQQRPEASRIRLHRSAESFVSGESSAVIGAIGGGPAVPTDRRLPASISGLRGHPTLVHNVETLSRISQIVRMGGSRFSLIGTPQDPGPHLLTVQRPGHRGAPVVLESTADASLVDVLLGAGINPDSVSAVLLGGFHGRWTRMDESARKPFGRIPGAGVIVALAPQVCPLRYTATVTRWLANESAGQCGPCRFGLPDLATAVQELADFPSTAAIQDIQDIHRLMGQVSRRGACFHPTGTANLVASALQVFPDEVDAHLAGRCTATESIRESA